MFLPADDKAQFLWVSHLPGAVATWSSGPAFPPTWVPVIPYHRATLTLSRCGATARPSLGQQQLLRSIEYAGRPERHRRPRRRDEFTLVLKTNGTVTGWGRSDLGRLSFPASLTNVTAIAAGAVMARSEKRCRVVAWGNNYYGQTSIHRSE